MRRSFVPGAAAGLLAVLICTMLFAPAVRAADEGELLRQIKNDVFNQEWSAVQAGCDQFITSFPHAEALPRAYYYRAQALEHLKGHEADAIEAYSEFLTRFPGETGAIREDALLSRMTLASSVYQKGDKRFVSVVLKGLQEKGYPKLYAAIQASKIDYPTARASALPILRECACSENDAELKNECVLALLRINPKALEQACGPSSPPPTQVASTPRGPSRPPEPAAPPSAASSGRDVRLIRVEVYDYAKKQVVVRVNLPIAFAELLLDSLGDAYRKEIIEGLKEQGHGAIDLDKLWKSIKEGGPQTILEVNNDEERIKVWVE